MDLPVFIYGCLLLAAAILVAAVIRTFGENPGPVGRFQFHTGPGGECCVLDTKTGALWERPAGSPDWVQLDSPWAIRKRPGGRPRPGRAEAGPGRGHAAPALPADWNKGATSLDVRKDKG